MVVFFCGILIVPAMRIVNKVHMIFFSRRRGRMIVCRVQPNGILLFVLASEGGWHKSSISFK